jgi:hypothetical protein
VLRQAIALAAAQEQDVADVPHLVAALTQPLPDEPVIQGGMTVFSPTADWAVRRAKQHARAEGSTVTGRRHLACANSATPRSPVPSPSRKARSKIR